MKHQIVRVAVGAAALAAGASVADAKTYQVGPGKEYAEPSEVADLLVAGDVVEIDGDHTYGPVEFDAGGADGAPVTVRGVAVNGKLPVIDGGDYTVILHGNHFVLESVEVTGGTLVCLLHKADDVTVRSVRVHDCPNHGILGTDAESGSITIEYSEIFATGEGDRHHQLYIATDESMYPGSVFRLQHTFIHDGNGGNNVKSRAERNEIYYNWIEEAEYHELDIIGPDGQDPGLAREDSDVVGNVLVKKPGNQFQIARLGGDGTGETGGRYRFTNNTMVVTFYNALVLRAQDSLDSIELHNNLIVKQGGGVVRLLRDDTGTWVSGARTISGENNWVPTGTEILDGMVGSVLGDDPGLEDLAALDVRPKEASPLVDAAAAPGEIASPAGHAFPSPEVVPVDLPPFGNAEAPGDTVPRPAAGAGLDIGAFEYGSGPPLTRPPDAGPGGGGDDDGGDDDGGGGATDGDGGCGCRIGAAATPPVFVGFAIATLAVAFAFAFGRRRRR